MDTLDRISHDDWMNGNEFTMSFLSGEPIAPHEEHAPNVVTSHKLRITPGTFYNEYVVGSIEAADDKQWPNYLLDLGENMLGENMQRWSRANQNDRTYFMIGIAYPEAQYPDTFEIRKCEETCEWTKGKYVTRARLQVIPKSRDLTDVTKEQIKDGAKSEDMNKILIIVIASLGALLVLGLFILLALISSATE